MMNDVVGRALAALGDPTRRLVYEAILVLPRRVGQLARDLPVSRPAVSHHVAVLKAAGLISDDGDGVLTAVVSPLPELRVYFDRLWFEASVGEGWIQSRYRVSHGLRAPEGMDVEA